MSDKTPDQQRTKVKFHGDMTLEKFWVDWFGVVGGRELGTDKYPQRDWTDNPNEMLEHIKICESEVRPCWITAQLFSYLLNKKDRRIGQPMAIEKLFHDFDDKWQKCHGCGKQGWDMSKKFENCPKCGVKLTKEDAYPRIKEVEKDVRRFVKNLRPIPFIVKTRKGFHVYMFLRRAYTFNPKHRVLVKKLYKELQEYYIRGEYPMMDERILGDISRMARVPLTAHEKTGEICQVMDRNLNPTKIRSLEFYRTYGIPESIVEKTMKTVRLKERKKREEEMREVKEVEQTFSGGGKFKGEIRPCFKHVMKIGEASHDQRLAWISEAYHSGYNTKAKLLELCRITWKDYKEQKSMEQINDYFKHERWKWKPYRCETIQQKGWCIEKDCPFYKYHS